MGRRIRDLPRLRRVYGHGRWRKLRGVALVRLPSGTLIRAGDKRRRPIAGFVVCINNTEYPASLELHKIYRVLADEDARREGDLRVVDESGEDYLYPAEWFVSVKLPHRVRGSLLRTR
mgnify:CR=1 FL=1